MKENLIGGSATLNFRIQTNPSANTISTPFSAYTELWVETALRRRLGNLQVTTEEDFLPGSDLIDAILDSIDKSRVIVFVWSPSFMRDGWCREAVLRAYSPRRHAVLDRLF